MKKSLFILAILFSHCAFSQNFTNSDVIKTFKGLTPEYQKYFNDNFSSFIETLNKLTSLDKSLVPMSLNITYENNQGYIQLIVNYDHQKQIEYLPSMFKAQLNMAKQMGSNGFSIYLPDLLMLCLNDYKYKVLTSSSFNSEIKKFQIKVRLKKTDGSWIKFYCKEYVDYNGVPRYAFEDFADIKYSTNKMCTITAENGSKNKKFKTNRTKLDEYKLWELGNPKNPDGTANCDNNAYKFFEIEK
jgi:hypothetical protein